MASPHTSIHPPTGRQIILALCDCLRSDNSPTFNVCCPGLSNRDAALAGALTGATESVAHNPFEVVKVRLQSTRFAHLRNSWHCVTDLIATEGVGSLYRGFEVRAQLTSILWILP